MEGRHFSLFFCHQEHGISPTQGPCLFSLAVLSQEQRKASEILVVKGSDYWVTLYLDIITFPSKAT